MAFVKKTIRQLKRTATELDKLSDKTAESFGILRDMIRELYEAISREIVPVVVSLRDEVNKTCGDTVNVGDEDYSILATDRRIICDNTIGVTVYLPSVEEKLIGQVFSVYRTGAAVTLQTQTGELVDGAASVAIGANSGVEVFCDGEGYLSA
jgi:hypothetical protein